MTLCSALLLATLARGSSALGPASGAPAEDRLFDCLAAGGSNLTESRMLGCSDSLGLSGNNSKCALKCTLEALGVYWACAAVCIEKLAPDSCITVGCPAAVASFDIKCAIPRSASECVW